jgi:imidazolonepropionase-like amidohydrolase
MVRWYAPAEILKMATADNAELLALSGERSPYQGKLGVIDIGVLADIKLLEDADKNLAVIMKDGKITRSRPRGRRLAARLHANSLSRKRAAVSRCGLPTPFDG